MSAIKSVCSMAAFVIFCASCVSVPLHENEPLQEWRTSINYQALVKRIVSDNDGRIDLVQTGHVDEENRTVLYFSEDRQNQEIRRHRISFDEKGWPETFEYLNLQDDVVSVVKVKRRDSFNSEQIRVSGTGNDDEPNSQLSSEEYLFDSDGYLSRRLIKVGSTGPASVQIDYEYNKQGNLIKTVSRDLINKSTIEDVTYTINESGMRIQASRDSGGDGSVEIVEDYFYADGNLVAINVTNGYGKLLLTERLYYERQNEPVYSPTMFAASAQPTVRVRGIDTFTNVNRQEVVY